MNVRNLSARFVKPVAIAIGLIAAYALIGFFLLPMLLTAKIPGLIEEATGRKASVEEIKFDPFLLKLSVKGFSMLEKDGKPFVGFDQFYTDLNVFRSIGNAALVIDKIILAKPSVQIVRFKDGSFNFDTLSQGKSEAPEEEKTDDDVFPLIIDRFSLREGRAGWFDQLSEKPKKEEMTPINFEIENLTTQASEQFPMHIAFSLGSGGQLDWQGTAGVHPIASSGKIKLDKLSLERIQELAISGPADFALQGTEMLELDYKVSYSDKGLDLAIDNSRIELKDLGFSSESSGLNVKSSKVVLESGYQASLAGEKWKFAADKTKLIVNGLQLLGVNNSKAFIEVPEALLEAVLVADNADKDIKLKFKGKNFSVKNYSLSELGNSVPYMDIPQLSLAGIDLDLAQQSLTVNSVKASDGNIKAWLDANGKFNYIALFADAYMAATDTEGSTEAAKKPAKTPEPESEPWHIQVSDVDVNGFAFTFEDKSLKKPMVMKAKPIEIKLSNFSNNKGQKLPLHFQAGINDSGSIKIDGDAVMEPFSTRLSLAVSNIELEKFQPYVEPHALLDIIDGKFNVDGDLSLAMDEAKGLDLKFKGDTSIAELVTRDQILHRDFVKWKKLTLQGIDADLQGNRYTAKQLLLNKPYARVTIKKDKSVNINDVFKPKETQPAAKKTPKQTAKVKSAGPYFKLGKFQIVDGSSDFADLSLILPFAAPIQNLNGGATGISSEPKSTIKVMLKGYAYELSPVDISGAVSPYLGNFNVELNFNGMPMPLVSPYMAQFAGYKVEKGKLTLGLKYQVNDKQLNASNSILIDQFELGEKVEHPDAVSLPLDLAVALLKDGNGKIKLDVPISGSLEDPEFSVGGIIADALLNTITKIITSPFTAIASLIGSEENLDVISFAPGQAALDAEQTKKLDGLAKALFDRPVLSLEIKGTAFQEQDWPALREAALVDQLKKMKADQINREGGKKTLAEYVELSDKDYKRLLADRFIEQFPQLADRSILGTPRLIDPGAGDFYQVAREKLSQTIKPEPQRLKDLASERAQAIAKFIVKQRGIPDARVFILDPAIDPDRKENKDIVTFLSLKTN